MLCVLLQYADTFSYHCHVHRGRRLTTLLQLAAGIISDLKLDTPPITGLKLEEKRKEFWNYPEELFGTDVRTHEERRAYLGYIDLASTYDGPLPLKFHR